METVNGFFSTDKTTFVNVAVPKSSPNRIGKVIEINKEFFITDENGVRRYYPFAVVQFRDFHENIAL